VSAITAIAGWLGPELTLVAYGAALVCAVFAAIETIRLLRRRRTAAAPIVREAGPQRQINPQEAEVSDEASRLVDSLKLRRDLVSVQLLRRVDNLNQGEVAGYSPKIAMRLFKTEAAVEYHAGLRRPIRRVRLEIYELLRAYELRVDDAELESVRGALSEAIEGYFKEIIAFPGQAEAQAHRRAWRDLVAAHEAESKDPGLGVIGYKDPDKALREWEDEYERVQRFWELEA